MRMADILDRKRNGETLTRQEIEYFVNGYTKAQIPDYQASALLMAICIRGMTDAETADLTDCMARSGAQMDLSAIDGITADKHSTGGVGDKTTLVVVPVCAAAGLKMAKMSGRGLGHTGGTIDKLESIPGFRTDLSMEAFFEQVNRIGLAITGQTAELAPADQKLYALRDASGTVSSIPLIASSIMSKKLAAGAQNIALDVKCGSGALMPLESDARHLAKQMVEIGKRCGRNVTAVITDMDAPLGTHIGNALEVTEACAVLKGRGDRDLRTLCLILSAHLIAMSLQKSQEEAFAIAEQALMSGAAFQKLWEMVVCQGGDAAVLEQESCFLQAKCTKTVFSPQSGYIAHTHAKRVGECASLLGAGRETKADRIDPAAGLILTKKTGAHIERGEPLATLFAADEDRLQAGEARFLASLTFSPQPPEKRPLIFDTIS